MAKHLFSLLFTLFIGIFIVVSYVYAPSSVTELNKKINNSKILPLDEKRISVVKEYGEFLSNGLPNSVPKLYFYWLSRQRKMSDLRVKRAINEIKDAQVEMEAVRVWSLLNMGVVVKTNKHTITFDTANLPFSQAHNELANIVDIFLVTHADGDHYDPSLLKKAVKKNKKIVLPEGFIFESEKPENITIISSGKTVDIDGVKITGYQTDHRGDGNFREPSFWFEVESDGFKLLHTGDGRDFKNKSESEEVYGMKDFDILLGNIMLHPFNIRDLKPRVYIPLHMYKFMSGQLSYQESTIENVLNTHKQYEKDLQGIDIVYLLPGESFIYPLETE